MNDATLQIYRDLAAALQSAHEHGAPLTWQWIGRWDSQRMFGISERRAKEYQSKFGGDARPMAPVAAAR